MDHCTSVSDFAYRQQLISASNHEVSVPRHRLNTYGRRAFAVAGPTLWNSVPENICYFVAKCVNISKTVADTSKVTIYD